MPYNHLILASDVAQGIDLYLLGEGITASSLRELLEAFRTGPLVGELVELDACINALAANREAVEELLRYRLTSDDLEVKAHWVVQLSRLLSAWLLQTLDDRDFQNKVEAQLSRQPFIDFADLFQPLGIAADCLGSGGVSRPELIAEVIQAKRQVSNLWQSLAPLPRV